MHDEQPLRPAPTGTPTGYLGRVWSGARAAGERAGEARLLAAVLTLLAMLLVLAGMHASMVDGTAMADGTMTGAAPAGMSAPVPHHGAVTATPTVVTDAFPLPSGAMGMLDCLLLGMLCVLAVAALVTGVILLTVLRRLLQLRIAARSLRSALAHLRVPDPPSPLLLSISRT